MWYNKTFQKYVKDLGSDRYSPLTPEKERELLLQYANGSEEAFNKIVNAYLRFVVFLLRGFKIPDDVDVMDIIQEGNLGFITGLKKFDSTKYDCRVSTYCKFWIEFFIKKALKANAKTRGVFSTLSENTGIEDVAVAEEDVSIRETVHDDIIKHVLKHLNDREKYIIKSFFGLEAPFKPKTLQEIAFVLHINIERVRQLRDRALQKLNKESLSQLVHDL